MQGYLGNRTIRKWSHNYNVSSKVFSFTFCLWKEYYHYFIAQESNGSKIWYNDI